MKLKNKILKYWKAGMSKRAISLKVGCQRSYVQNIIKQYELLTNLSTHPVPRQAA